MNITTVTFSSKTETYGLAAPALWQYDYGQVLKIEGLDLPTAYQVEFANSANAGQTITEVGNADGVSIPDSLLETGKNVYAFVFLHDEETDGETEYKITILVNPRPSRPNDTPTPEQETAIDQAIAALNDAVDRTDASAEAAAGSASSAAQSAADAGTAAETAQSAAQGAQASAAAAAASETNAGNSAEAAAGAASTAQAAAATAGQAATGAAQSAAAAAEDAGAAEQSAGDAAAAKTAAQASAASAAASAQSAAGSAQTASDAVTAVQQSAESAQTSATAAAGSASSAAGSATEAAQSAAAAAASEAEAQRIETKLAPYEDLPQIQEAVEKITDIVVAEAEWYANSYWRTDFTTISETPSRGSATVGWQCAEMACSPGDVFVVHLQGGNLANAVCFIDSARAPIKKIGTGNYVLNGRVVAPEGAVALIVNDNGSTGSCVQVKGSGLVEEIATGGLLGQHGDNLLTFGELTTGYLNASGGIVTSDTTRVVSDYIRVAPGMTYRLRMRLPKATATSGVFHRCGTYDAEGRWIGLTGDAAVTTADFEDDTYYYVDYRYSFDATVAFVRVVMRTYGLDGVASFEAETAPFMPDLGEEVRELKSSVTQTVTVTGTDPVITAADNRRYVCGEVYTLSLTPPASGICDVVFTSGTTATVLTVPNTVKWPSWFDPTALEASVTYEINICDGLAVVATWAV